MRLPHTLIESLFFSFDTLEEFKSALNEYVPADEIPRIERLCVIGLPPLTSIEALAVAIGVNPGILWSVVNQSHKHYRVFKIPKGKDSRTIVAPKIALKIIQKWLAYNLEKIVKPAVHVFGFVKGRSHIGAAAQHLGAKWVYSLDIEEFFPTTPLEVVSHALEKLGYDKESADLVSQICCYKGALAQGAPSSPTLSNLVMMDVDDKLSELAQKFDVRLTRYADDIVFSGYAEFPEDLLLAVPAVFSNTPWRLSEKKTRLDKAPGRLKVHGLLVDGDTVRLSKGYRNKIRAYHHLLQNGKVKDKDYFRLMGHIKFLDQVLNFNESLPKPQK